MGGKIYGKKWSVESLMAEKIVICGHRNELAKNIAEFFGLISRRRKNVERCKCSNVKNNYVVGVLVDVIVALHEVGVWPKQHDMLLLTYGRAPPNIFTPK